jgi:uncharacterized protein
MPDAAPPPAASGEPDAPLSLVVRARWPILAVFFALCAWLVPGVRELQHDDDVLAFLPPEHPDVVAFREVADRFGMLEVALVGLRAPEGADLLTPERSEQVRALARTIAELPGTRLVLDYPNLPDLRVDGDTLAVDPLVPKGERDPKVVRARVLGNHDAVGNLVSADGTAAALLVYLLPAGEGASGRTARLAGIREAVAAQWDGEAYFGGAPFIETNAASASRADIERLSPVVIAVLTITSALLLRSITAALMNLVVAGIGVALVVGAHGRFGEPFTIVSSTMPVLMVALGGAFGMHLISGYQRRSGSSRARASGALRELWLAVVLSAATTAVAFFALYVMPQLPMKRFGMVAGLGVLVLLVIALLVVPGLLSLLPARLLRPRPSATVPFSMRPPLWSLALLCAAGLFFGARLQADPDTRSVFDPDSEPARADQFFNDHFGGSQYLQIAIEADLRDPVVLREIRELTTRLKAVEGVVDVRSLVEPVEMLTEGFGGRRGLPRDQAQARRVLGNLADHPAMAQLLTTDLGGAIVHVKLAPLDSEALVETTASIRAIIDALPTGPLRVGVHTEPAVAATQKEAVRVRAEAELGRPLPVTELDALLDPGHADRALLGEAERLRERALGTDEVIEPLAPEIYADVEPAQLLALRGKPLQDYLRERLPELVAKDPEGVRYAGEQLEGWITEARTRVRIEAICGRLGLANAPAGAAARAVPEGMEGMGFEEPAAAPSGACAAFANVLSELDDREWSIPADATQVTAVREVPWRVQLTGQPLIGQAFAESVTTSLYTSTLASFVALALVLVLGGHLLAIVPATWTVAVTLGVIELLGHPIGIGTSMVSCVAMGAGVDFAIHLSVRARASTSPARGSEAVAELGGVAIVTGLQLAAAFLVLLASGMPPLRQFGGGLAIGLMVAAAGAVWFAPILFDRRR